MLRIAFRDAQAQRRNAIVMQTGMRRDADRMTAHNVSDGMVMQWLCQRNFIAFS
jgi:hypothetical protein